MKYLTDYQWATQNVWFKITDEIGNVKYWYTTREMADHHLFNLEHKIVDKPPANYIKKQIDLAEKGIEKNQRDIDFYKEFL